MKILRKLLVFVIVISLFSCKDITSSDSIAIAEITSILDNIEDEFNFSFNIDSIMDNYNDDFLHNSYNKIDENFSWIERYQLYDEIVFSNIEIDVEDNYAVASFILSFKNNSQLLQQYSEPSEEFGFLSYFVKDNGEWLIFGNQFN